MGVASDVELPEPVDDLLNTAASVVRPWLSSLVQRNIGAHTTDESDQLIESSSTALLEALARLLATDVDAQTANPLALFRASTVPITAWLQRQGVAPLQRDPFANEKFPADVYGLFPARWDDIDPSLQSPGITWGAWKAMTILQRRRAEGTR